MPISLDESSINNENEKQKQEAKLREEVKPREEAKLKEEAIGYFRQEKGLSRLLKAITTKYERLGRWGGTVSLPALQEEEKEALSAFFRRDLHHHDSLRLRLEDFAEALSLTRYAPIPVLELLAGIKGAPLQTRAELAEESERAKSDFFAQFRSLYAGAYCQAFLQAVERKEPGTRGVLLAYDKNLAYDKCLAEEKNLTQLKENLEHVLQALSELNVRIELKLKRVQEYERLPVFARRVTGDPHGFDRETEAGRFLLSALAILKDKKSKERSATALVDLAPIAELSGSEELDTSLEITGAEGLNELYYEFGLLRDELWNFVTCTGMMAWEDTFEPLPVWQAAYFQPAVLNVPLREMIKLKKALPGNLYHTVEKIKYEPKVYVVENSGVFSALLDLFEQEIQDRPVNGSVQEPQPYPPIICTHGQFKLATLILLDRLAEQKTMIYYSGDFDPEGLSMLNRLFLRYPGQVVPWHFSLADYRVCLSKESIAPHRLKQLSSVNIPEVLPVKEEILARKKAGYQEGILHELWEDIKKTNILIEHSNA